MKAMYERPADMGASGMPLVGDIERTEEAKWRTPPTHQRSEQRIALQPSGMRLIPGSALVWLVGSLGVAGCIAPWVAHGWLWLDLIAAGVVLAACYDAIALRIARNELVPVLLSQEKGLRGREGQGLSLPLALAGPYRSRRPEEIQIAIMPATAESETALRVKTDPQRLKLERLEAAERRPTSAATAPIQFWPWTPEIALLRRGLWPAPCVGIERRSRLKIWRLRRWFDLAVPLRIDADLRQGRREILRSPIYRALVAARETPWTGHGRDFERLREYQRGDNFSEIAWKSTARRGTPVTRLFQWEQRQEVYFVVDQSRTSALAIDPAGKSEANPQQARAPRRQLDLAVEAALVGASVALELGDEFGLITYAEEPKSWLRAGSGQFEFHKFRDRLLNLEPLPTTSDYEALFSKIRIRLPRRSYLVLLADVAERSISHSLWRGIAMLRSAHVVLRTSPLPTHAHPIFSPGEQRRTDQDVYTSLAGEKEHQRLEAVARKLRQSGVELRFVSPENFLRTAVEGYLQSKREQRI